MTWIHCPTKKRKGKRYSVGGKQWETSGKQTRPNRSSKNEEEDVDIDVHTNIPSQASVGKQRGRRQKKRYVQRWLFFLYRESSMSAMKMSERSDKALDNQSLGSRATQGQAGKTSVHGVPSSGGTHYAEDAHQVSSTGA